MLTTLTSTSFETKQRSKSSRLFALVFAERNLNSSYKQAKRILVSENHLVILKLFESDVIKKQRSRSNWLYDRRGSVRKIFLADLKSLKRKVRFKTRTQIVVLSM